MVQILERVQAHYESHEMPFVYCLRVASGLSSSRVRTVSPRMVLIRYQYHNHL